MKPIFWIFSLLFALSSCHRSDTRDVQTSHVSDGDILDSTSPFTTVIQLVTSIGVAQASVEPSFKRLHRRAQAGLLVIGLLASYNVADLAFASIDDQRLHDVVFNLVTASGDTYYSFTRRDLVRHFREFEEFYLNQSVDDLVDSHGEVHDQFLQDLLTTAQDRVTSADQKRDFIRQILAVLQEDGPTNRQWLSEKEVTDPLAIELHRAKNGLQEEAEARRALENARKTAMVTIGINSSIFGSVDSSLKSKSDKVAGLVLVAAGSGLISTALLAGENPVIELRDVHRHIVLLGKGDIYSSFAAYRMHFANLSLEDIYDEEEGITDSFARDFVDGMTEGKVSLEKEKELLRQLLIVAHAEPDTSMNQLRLRGIKDTRFLEIFKTWQLLREDFRGEDLVE